MKRRLISYLLALAVILIPAAVSSDAVYAGSSADASADISLDAALPAETVTDQARMTGEQEGEEQEQEPEEKHSPGWDGNQYYDKNGSLCKGFFRAGGKLYYADENGMVRRELRQLVVNGRTYQSNSDGVILTGVHSWKGKKYISDENGVLNASPGFTSYKDNTYYLDLDYHVFTSRRFTVNGHTYFANKKGHILKGRFKWTDGRYYFTNKKGALPVRSGFVKDEDGKIYFADVDQDGAITVDKRFKFKNNTYFAGSRGALRTGLFKWKDGNTYYTNEKGALRKKAGFVNAGGSSYYVKSDGTILKDSRFVASGGTYMASGDGHIVTGFYKVGKKKFYAEKNGAVRVSAGFIKEGGKKYFNRRGGGIKVRTFLKYRGKYYYAGKDGVIATKNFRYQGVAVRPDRKTGEISLKTYRKLFPKFDYTNYVLIDLSDQKLTYYEDGEKIMSCKVITGKPKTPTQEGAFRIRSKSSKVLIAGRKTMKYAKFWMDIDGGDTGIHDASWVEKFGGTIYKKKGSGGNIMLPSAPAGKLYKRVRIGTPVLIRK